MCFEHASTFAVASISLTSIRASFPFTRRKCPICESGEVYNTLEVIWEGEYGKEKDTSAAREDLGYSRSNSNEIKEMTAEYIDYIYLTSWGASKEQLTENFQLFDVCSIV